MASVPKTVERDDEQGEMEKTGNAVAIPPGQVARGACARAGEACDA